MRTPLIATAALMLAAGPVPAQDLSPGASDSAGGVIDRNDRDRDLPSIEDTGPDFDVGPRIDTGGPPDSGSGLDRRDGTSQLGGSDPFDTGPDPQAGRRTEGAFAE